MITIYNYSTVDNTIITSNPNLARQLSQSKTKREHKESWKEAKQRLQSMKHREMCRLGPSEAEYVG